MNKEEMHAKRVTEMARQIQLARELYARFMAVKAKKKKHG